MFACSHVRPDTHMHIYLYECMYVYVYIMIYIFRCIQKNIFVIVHAYTPRQICTCIHTTAQIPSTYTRMNISSEVPTYIQARIEYSHLRAHSCIYTPLCICIHIHARTRIIYIYIYTHVTYIYIYRCICQLYKCIHMHGYAYRHTHMHIYVYIYIDTYICR